jgi:type II secretory pathway component GspD/PulD (secretin)
VNIFRRVPILALFAVSLAPAAIAQVPSLDARVSINVIEQELSQIVQHLRERSGANIVLLEGGDRVVRDLQINDVYWRDVLDYAAELAGCVVEEDKSGVLTVSAPPRVTFEFPNADINEIISTIAKVSGANVIVGPEVAGTLSVRLNDVPWRNALEEVVKTRGYVVVEEQRNILRVVDPLSLQKQLITRSYQLRYMRPRGNYIPKIKSEFITGKPLAPVGQPAEHFTVLDAFRAALTQGVGKLDYITTQNVIILRDTAQVHEQVQEMLRRLDVEPAQVFIDVRFVSTTNTDLLNLGIDYGDGGPQISVSGGQIPVVLPFDLGAGGFEDGLIANTGGIGPFSDPTLSDSNVLIPDTIFGALSFTQLQATLRLLQRDTNSEVIQAPKLITMDGNEATIFVGETVRYAEAKSEQGQAGGLQLSVEEAGGSPVEVGFQLLVRPYVIPGSSKIMMEVIPKETSLSGSSGDTTLAPPGFDIFTIGAAGLEGSIALPRTRSSTMVTKMLLESNQTAVIGGLSTDVDAETRSRVPFVSRIPILGELFKYKTESRERRSLLIFVTPTLVHSAEDTEYLLQKELSRRQIRLHDELEALYNGDDQG